MSMKKFKLGDKTKKVWAGDIVTECEFICDLDRGNMLFYDTKFKCFSRVFQEPYGKQILNGWDCADKPSELI